MWQFVTVTYDITLNFNPKLKIIERKVKWKWKWENKIKFTVHNSDIPHGWQSWL